MTSWKLAAVQMDCRLGDRAHNLNTVRVKLREAAAQGAKLIVFPECALTGYGFENKNEAWSHAEPLPGPSTDTLAGDCRELGVWVIAGMLEQDADGKRLFNSCALVGPSGYQASYRKIHLPCLGVDRFTTAGDRPFAVHDLGGLRVGMSICYDGSFPETSRVLMLLGADLIVLPTNWPLQARSTMRYLVQARALENHVYYAAVNRIGEERGFRFLGHSRIVDCNGELLAASNCDHAEILYAELDPARPRDKHIVKIPKTYELHRLAHRRPDMYGPICADQRKV
jgi:predicted amidohydrolase